MTVDDLIQHAASVVKAKKNGEFTIANVGCALLSKSGMLYLGVNVDTGSSMGYCAEHNAIGTMITDGEYQIDTVVAVWLDDDENIYILSPCGRCREFMQQIDERNLDANVILDVENVVKLRELLPFNDWFHPINRKRDS
jgi:cytidine deaminase